MKTILIIGCLFLFGQYHVQAGVQRLASNNPDEQIVDDPSVIQEVSNSANNSIHTAYQTLKSSAKDIGQYVSNKFHDIHNLLKGCKNKEEVLEAIKYNLDDDPKLKDPYFIADMFDKHKLADYNATNVIVKGMANFRHSSLDIDQKQKKANLILKVDKIIISGIYGFKNLLKQNTGPFQIELIDVIFTEKMTYEDYGKETDREILESDANIKFAKSNRKFENLGWVNKVFEGIIGYRIITNTLKDITSLIHFEMRPLVLSKLRSLENRKTSIGDDSSKKNDGDKQLSKLEESFKNIIAEARPAVLNYPSFELLGEEVVIEESGYHAEITYMTVSPLSKFDIDSLQFPLYDDKVQIIFDINIGSISGSAEVVLKQLLDKKNCTITYRTDDLHLGAILEKKLTEHGYFELVNSHAILSKVDVIIPADIGDENVRPFLEEQLPTAIKSALVKRFITLADSAVQKTLSEHSIDPRINS